MRTIIIIITSSKGGSVSGKRPCHVSRRLQMTFKALLLANAAMTAGMLAVMPQAHADSVAHKTSQTDTSALPTLSVQGQKTTADTPVQGFLATRDTSATKTDTPILETPQAVTVITQDRMQVLNTRSISEALRYTAGVNADSYGADVRGFYGSIRAFTPDVYLDGTRTIITTTSQAFQIEPWGMERIEVLRGAVSPLYGSGNLGGLINAVSKQPRLNQQNQMQIQGGSFGRIQGAVDVGGKLNKSGTLLWRFNALLRDSGTGYKNIKNNRIYIAPSIAWKPDADTSVTLLASYMQDDGGSTAQFLPAKGTVLPNPNGRIPRDFLNGDEQFDVYSKRQIAVGYAAEHHILSNWVVRQNMRFAHLDLNYRSIYGNGYAGRSLRTLNRVAMWQQPIMNTVTLDTNTEYKIATGPIGHDILLGVDFRSNANQQRNASINGPTLDVFAPVYRSFTWPTFAGPRGVRLTSTNQTQTQTGVYLQDQLSYHNWHLTLTGRQDFASTTTVNNLKKSTTSQDNQAFTGRAALLYAFPNGVSPYAAYSTSFLPQAGTDMDGNGFQPLTGDQIEVGIKYQPPSTNVLFTAAAYDLHQQNVLTPNPIAPTFSVQTGEIRSRGIELEATGKITQNLSLISAFTYQEPLITKSNVAGATGSRPFAQPSHMASVFLDYTYPVNEDLSVGLGAGTRYTGETAGDVPNTFTVPSFLMFDLVAHADYKQWRLQVNATNLTDKTFVAACSSMNGCAYGQGRAVFASLGYRW
ncbi:Outer membrane siderophore receptor [Granulibacter bethesdensis]|uniref:Outer membrane siderophore receptor n=2 Tax=Granulibacter bethesdensis TaxID=364410 RepID=A0AAC9K6B2_9PROT|nr:Outer membrane siderophore receptor [Granulibacter bethesdensis]APH60972.1 Outer membrane siderophore receptor [Granulibacter bethesdensis]